MSLSEETASGKNPEYDLFIKSVGIERKVENRERKRECDDEKPVQMGEIIIKEVLHKSICSLDYCRIQWNAVCIVKLISVAN